MFYFKQKSSSSKTLFLKKNTYSMYSRNIDCFVVNSLCLRPHSLVHFKFVAFCLLFVIRKQQVKQYNYCMYVDQSELLTSSWTDFTSSVWNFLSPRRRCSSWWNVPRGINAILYPMLKICIHNLLEKTDTSISRRGRLLLFFSGMGLCINHWLGDRKVTLSAEKCVDLSHPDLVT